MDKQSQETLKRILDKEKTALFAEEVAFLKARKSYLSKEQVEKYLEEEKVEKVSRKKQPSKKK